MTNEKEIPMSDELAVQQVLARYSRAHDRRDGAAMGSLFTPEARVTIFYNNNPDGKPELIGELTGREAIAQATMHMMKPHPPRGWSHNATDGLLIDIDGDRATVDAQFMVFSILGDAKPASGWRRVRRLRWARSRRSSLATTRRSWFAWRDSGSSSRCRFDITCRLPSEADGCDESGCLSSLWRRGVGIHRRPGPEA